MSRRTYDYKAMEARFIQTDDSLRQIAADYGCAISSIAAVAKADKWDEKRATFKGKIADRAIEALAERRATKVQVIVDDFLTTLHAAVQRLGLDMVDRWEEDPETGTRVFVRAHGVDPKGVAILLEKMQVLMGQPGSIQRNESINADLGDLPPDIARLILERTQGAVVGGQGPGSTGEYPIPRPESPGAFEGRLAIPVGGNVPGN